MKRNRSLIVVVLIALHIGLVTAYVFPDRIIPEKLRMFATAYARSLFHQQWQLFAPDPPLCSCELQWRLPNEEWRAIEGSADHYLQKRIAQNLARHAQADLRSNGMVNPLTIEAMKRIVGRKAKIGSRLYEQCVIEPQQSAEREERITLIE